MSMIAEVREQMMHQVGRLEEARTLGQATIARVDEIRQRIYRVLADSQSPDVGRAHQVVAQVIDALTVACTGLDQAAMVAQQRAAQL